MTARGRKHAIDGNIFNISRCSSWDVSLDWIRVIVDGSDRGADIQEWIMYGIFRREGREDEQLRRGRD